MSKSFCNRVYRQVRAETLLNSCACSEAYRQPVVLICIFILYIDFDLRASEIGETIYYRRDPRNNFISSTLSLDDLDDVALGRK